MRKKVLWIEDDAFNELGMFATPVHLTGQYELEYAVSATEAIDRLSGTEYDAVVVDVRIPPGDDRRWVDIFYGAGANKKDARLGVRLLQNVLGNDRLWTGGLPAAARDKQRYGILSMDRWEDISSDLDPVGVRLYCNKRSSEGSRVLLRMIQKILAQRNGGDYP